MENKDRTSGTCSNCGHGKGLLACPNGSIDENWNIVVADKVQPAVGLRSVFIKNQNLNGSSNTKILWTDEDVNESTASPSIQQNRKEERICILRTSVLRGSIGLTKLIQLVIKSCPVVGPIREGQHEFMISHVDCLIKIEEADVSRSEMFPDRSQTFGKTAPGNPTPATTERRTHDHSTLDQSYQ